MTNSIRKNLTQPADWWAAFEAQARKEGMTLSEWVGWHCRAILPKRTAAKLSERPAAHRPKKDESK